MKRTEVYSKDYQGTEDSKRAGVDYYRDPQDTIENSLEKMCIVNESRYRGIDGSMKTDKAFLYFELTSSAHIILSGEPKDGSLCSKCRYTRRITLQIMPECAEIPVEIRKLLTERGFEPQKGYTPK